MSLGPILMLIVLLAALAATALHVPAFVSGGKARVSPGLFALLAVLVAGLTFVPLAFGVVRSTTGMSLVVDDALLLPIALGVLLVMTIIPVLRAGAGSGVTWLPMMAVLGVSAMIATSAAYVAGLRDPLWVTLLAAAGGMLALNLWIASRLLRRGWARVAYVAQLGLVVMTAGLVVTALFSRTERITMAQGESHEALGHRITFTTRTDEGARGATADLRLEQGGWDMTARPRIAALARGAGIRYTPATAWLREVVVTPVDMVVRPAVASEAQWLLKNEPLTYAGTQYVFRGFRMERNGERFVALADLDVTREGHVTRVSPGLSASAAGSVPVAAEVPGLGTVSLARLDADHGRVAIVPPGASAATPVAVVDVGTRPGLNMVWSGALLALIGTVLSTVWRARELAREDSRRVASRAGDGSAEAAPTPI